jgi:hypothetical protein
MEANCSENRCRHQETYADPKVAKEEAKPKRRHVFTSSSLPPLTSLLFVVMVTLTHALLLLRTLRERQTRREAGTQSLRASSI